MVGNSLVPTIDELPFKIVKSAHLEMRQFKIVRMQGSQDRVIARIENLLICKAAFEKALFVYPEVHLEMRQGARIILMSKEESRS